MFAYIVKKVLSGLVVLGLVTVSVFLLFWFGPKEPAKPLCDQATGNRCDQERLDRYTEALGYNNPWYSEYGKFVGGLFIGREIVVDSDTLDCPAPCLGISYKSSVPVFEEMKERIPATVSVAVGGALMYVAIGLPLGIAAARRRGSKMDRTLVSTFLVISSIPYYLFALIIWLYVSLKWEVPGISDTGYFPLTENPVKWFTGLSLAWICLGLFGCTAYTRYMRGSMVESLSEDYVRTARAKGLPERAVVMKHALRSALVPVVTIFGLDLGILLAGTIFTEFIFDINGIGKWGLAAVYQKDFPVVLGTALFGAVAVIISNLVVDLAYSFLDPRVRLT